MTAHKQSRRFSFGETSLLLRELTAQPLGKEEGKLEVMASWAALSKDFPDVGLERGGRNTVFLYDVADGKLGKGYYNHHQNGLEYNKNT
ncbi:unnamed protein product [Pieris macdunnoughi]|uniref:Uncharacterized protein n=1 Tax=Pieris macdunnoughi TaxID=345717 RepID=A0A821S915_9NEOP|nr:unnamed protein product [Pieris macdunnoughi]